MFTVFISAGSNLGERKKNIRRSLEILSGRCKIYSVSSIYETEPVGNPDQPEFLNSMFEIGTTMLPHCLLKFLKGIEIDMGREKKERWGPRIIDLDIIFYGNLVMETPGLKIPHPDAHKRKFVLEPLCELYPELMHPLFKKPVKTIFKNLDSNKKTRKIQ
jgi:2-amino-4-hydroxy-6-hydroxymethyldihydropteridine diphosphokinase